MYHIIQLKETFYICRQVIFDFIPIHFEYIIEADTKSLTTDFTFITLCINIRVLLNHCLIYMNQVLLKTEFQRYFYTYALFRQLKKNNPSNTNFYT